MAELSQLIELSKIEVAITANITVTLLFWHEGSRINNHILQNKRADYGKQIVSTVSAQLEKENETGRTNLRMQCPGNF